MPLIILPNQLFDITILLKNCLDGHIIFWEYDHYFTKYKYNRLKLIFHRITMKLYYNKIKDDKRFKRVSYIDYQTNFILPDGSIMFDSADDIIISSNVKIIQNPNFLLNNENHIEYYEKTKKFYFNNFYMHFKSKLNILPKLKSTDKENRLQIKNDQMKNIPQDYKIKLTPQEKKILLDSINYVRKNFYNNPGPEWQEIEKNWNIPVTINHALNKWSYFLKNKASNFAKYQDFMIFDTNISEIYHSGISMVLNIGFINPNQLIKDAVKLSNINVKEAFIRQLFWREYQLYCYRYCKKLRQKRNFFNTTKKLTKAWYNGTTNIYPIDFCIKKAFNTGYLHHIERLMVIGNFMLLYGIDPKQGFKWFMEFSLDSYEWVMYQNVYDMVFNTTNGTTMRRIYISSSNYILKMSNIKGNPEWAKIWDDLYHNFLKKNKNKIGYPYIFD
jgi:deoxyribodipyrimidine photolyase-related protein